MSFKLSVLKAGVIKTFIIIAFVFFVALNENRLLSKINKIFARLFLIKGFFEFDFLYKIMTTMIQFTNLMRGALYMFVLHRQLNNN